MALPHSEVIDEVPYASPDDILHRYVRNRDEWTEPMEQAVYSMLLDRTDFIDDRTGKAWRRRRVTNDTKATPKFSALQKNPRRRRRARMRRGGGRRRLSPQREIDPWVDAQLSFREIYEVEELVVIRGRQTEDITDEGPDDLQTDPGPRDGDHWYIQPDRGRLKIDLRKFTVNSYDISGRIVTDDVGLRVSYVYGFDEEEQVVDDGLNSPSESVPGSLSDACAKLVAADIMETDQYGGLFRSSSDGDVELSDSAAALRQEAMDEIRDHRRRQV